MRLWSILAALSVALSAQTPAPRPPKLVVAIVIDQFRYDYLSKYQSEYTGGLKRMLDQGAVFTNAYYQHVPTVTAVGHSTFLSGATPALSGIIGNDWFDRVENKRVTSVTPPPGSKGGKMVGAEGQGSTPERLIQSTVGDELKLSGKGGKVVSVSLKDRSAILLGGHMADGAYWFDDGSGNFVSSTYYFPTSELPAWASELNRSRPGDQYAGREWLGHKAPTRPGRTLYADLAASPWSNELIQTASLAALKAEKLGTGNKIDLLAVSYSGNDYVGHRYGPEADESHDMAIRVDKLIGDLLRAAELQAGAGRVLFVLSADHGVSPVPERNMERKLPGGRTDATAARQAVERALTARFGAGTWVRDSTESGYYLSPNPIPGRTLDRGDVERVAAEALRAQPHVFRVYTRTQLLNGAAEMDTVGIRVRNGFNEIRSPDLVVLYDPYFLGGGPGGTTHGAPFTYDTHVPVMFLSPLVKPGRYNFNIAVNDIAPTLATLLDIEPPSGNVGRALHEIMK